jgi:HK97 family phage portal protein
MRVFGYDVTLAPSLTKAAAPLRPVGGRSWWPIIREPFTGAWQKNEEVVVGDALAYFAVFACVTLIASDIGKLHLALVTEDEHGIWTETDNPAWSPVLRRPNRYQNIIKFVEQWITSKLLHGNTYVLKQRDQRGVVNALYVLDPTRVTPLVAPDGSVFYDIAREDLIDPTGAAIAASGVGRFAVPAREIIHDLMVALYHPLIGVSPIYACGLSAMQGLKIQTNSSAFFANGSKPGGVLTAPGAISDDTAARLKEYWEANFSGENVGRVAVLGDGLKYEAMTVNPVDADMVNQLKWTASTVCSCFHVPPYMVNIGDAPPYANAEPLLQQYFSQCLQSLITNFELCLDEGLELPTPYGTEFDIDDLIWMDTATKTKAAQEGIGGGALKPDEARMKYFGLGPVKGGDTPYMQQQYFSLAALAERDANNPLGQPPAPVPAPPPSDPNAVDFAAYARAIRLKAAELLHVA